ncbi:unnamed protein product [Cylindrotheca closterium]|uniref:Uncharacterized protein n=1 Tax=Cylindrotheca closterium TaxID=2856 RepID=A0AAD2CFS9_9STRA|nr:unnamed protein product [Cylindrotheca closterium]
MSRTMSSLRACRQSRKPQPCFNSSASTSTRILMEAMNPQQIKITEGKQIRRITNQFQPTSSHHAHQQLIPRSFHSYSYSYSSLKPSPTSSTPLSRMNLESAASAIIIPKRIVLPSSSSSSSSSSRHNDDRCSYINPWDTSDESTLPPIDYDIRLDRQTRFLLQLLKEKRMHGLRNPRFHRKSVPETLTTEKCHYWLQQLAATTAAATESNNNVGISTLSDQCWQRAERARLILEHMEAIADDFRQSCHRRNQRQDDAEAATWHMNGMHRENRSSLSPLTESSRTLPLPTSETYMLVLKLYATKYLHGEVSVPETCRAIVERMQQNALVTFDADVKEGEEDGQITGKTSQKTANQGHIVSSLSPVPTTQHWNQVIIAWANSMDPKRPIHAAQIAHALDEQGMADASTFSHALRACVSLDSRQQVATPEFIQLALPVAQKLQNGLLARQLQNREDPKKVPLEAFHIVHLLRVARNLLPSRKEQQELRNEMIRNTWQMATSLQKINVHVVQELLQVASPGLVHELIQSEKGDAKSISAEIMKDPLQLIQVLPTEWIDHSTPDQDPYQW